MREGESVENVLTERAQGSIMLDFDAESRLLGVEMPGATALLPPRDNRWRRRAQVATASRAPGRDTPRNREGLRIYSAAVRGLPCTVLLRATVIVFLRLLRVQMPVVE